MSYGMVAPFDAGQRFQWRVRIRSQEDLSLYAVLSGRADGYTDILALRQFQFNAQDSRIDRRPCANKKLRRNESPDWPSGLFHNSVVDFPSSREENPPKLPTDVLRFRRCGMYQPPPFRGRSVFDDKKVLLIDPHEHARDVRARVLRSRGIEVDATDSLPGGANSVATPCLRLDIAGCQWTSPWRGSRFLP